jgi:hypothetical protein
MAIADTLLHVLDLAKDWSVRARGFAFLLTLPLIIVGIADWRIRRRR